MNIENTANRDDVMSVLAVPCDRAVVVSKAEGEKILEQIRNITASKEEKVLLNVYHKNWGGSAKSGEQS